MPIEAVKIPQNVYIEDRIVGPLTLRQIIICAGGGGISYALWASVSKAYGQVGLMETVILCIPALMAVMFAFIRINDLSLLRIVLLSFERMSKPSVRVFEPRQGLMIHVRTFATPKEEKKEEDTLAIAPEQQLQNVSRVLDSMKTRPALALTTEEVNQNVRRAEGVGVDPDPDILPPPVNRKRIAAEPLDTARSVDDIRSGQSGSFFRDLSPA